MSAVWDVAATGAPVSHTPLEQSVDADVAIVGAGITGLTAALRLAEAGRRVVVLEALRVGEGNTGHSTGNLYGTLAQGLAPIARKWGSDVAREVVDARARAIDSIETLTERHAIECQFRRCPLYFVSSGQDPSVEQQLEEEYRVSTAAGLGGTLTDEVPLAAMGRRALRLDHQAQLNPLRYVQGLASAAAHNGAAIHEHSRVVAMDADQGRLATEHAEIRARCVVQATHTPKGVSMLQTALLPYREYGISARLNSATYPDGTFWMMDSGHSIRGYRHNDNDYLVVVGGKHKTGEGTLGGAHYDRLREYVRSRFDVAGFEHWWSAQQYTAADRLPYIGRAPGAEAAFVATGYAADGLAWGTVAGSMIADRILGREHPLAERFSPTRLTPAKSAREWLRENLSVAGHYARDRLSAAQVESLGEIPAGEGRVVSMDGEKLAVCRDGDGRLSVLSAVCPHMRCLVQWNGADATWDCPCHGSRFRADGTVIEGPAYNGLTPRAAQE